MNYRVTVGFLAAALILAAIVTGLDRFNIGPTSANQASGTATVTASQQPQIFSFDDSKVTRFEIRQGDKSATVVKQNDQWTIDPGGEPANRSSFTSLIVRMSQLKATRLVDASGGDLSQYGLDTPKDVAIATLEDGTKYELDIGTASPVQTGTYVKAGDDPATYVIPNQFVTDLERLLNDPKEPPTPTPRPSTPTPETTPLPDTTATPTS